MTIMPKFETPFERRGVLVPGMPILEPGVERHPVPGGGSRAIEVRRGDEIGVLDVEGLQVAELTIFAPDGRSDAAMLGGSSSGPPSGLMAQLARQEPSARRTASALRAAGFDLSSAQSVHAFADGSKPGDQAVFTCQVDGLLIACAPGGPMAPDRQDTTTELIVYIRRANPVAFKSGQAPPPPLADPLIDINIQPGNARAYEAKKGQFIQILDVQGRECSDFQAFALGALDNGSEREIDPTATRTQMGSLYPGPGIYAKYWTVDNEPLVEIIQDTCGRHDTFGLACTARHYEDMGYPGHANCTDNMNAELAHYGIRPRGGWPAINFFFNTMLDQAHSIQFDEPWSRPGDFVLLQAQTDLVCVSTGCPSDINPANGWNPTDIQVRVYGEQEDFERSIGWRKTPEGTLQETKKPGFYESFAKHTRDFMAVGGNWLPNSFTNYGSIAEYWACREHAAVMDLSSLKKFEVTGPDAEALMQLCVTRNMKKLSRFQVVYTAMCYEHGGMIDDGTVFRLDDHCFRWIGGCDSSGLWLREQAEKNGLEAYVRSSSDQMCNIAIQGPKSREILSSIMWTAPTHATVDELAWFRFTVARLNDLSGPACVISRTGYTGELGYELFCNPKDAATLFDAIWQAGQPFEMAPLGFAALNTLRVESGLIIAGREFSDQTDPFEAGISFTVPLKSKDDDFIGKQALIERKAHPQKKLVGLDIEGAVVPSHGDCVRIGRAQVGVITSAVKSPILNKVIALARVDVTHSEPGTPIEIGQLDGQQKRLKATVVKFPHFDPTKERVKGNYS